MPNFSPAAARPVRRLVSALLVLLTAAVCTPAVLAGPEPTSPPAATPADRGHDPAPAVPPLDAVMRLLADKSLASPPPVAQGPAPDLASGESRFVDRFRDKASDMVLTAMNFLGTPYKRGGNNADHGFDCSGFTRHVFEMSLGLVLPRRADEQATTAGLLRIDREQLRPGDLVFFNTMRRTFSHVGIYVGAGKFIHSPKPGGEVRVDDLHAGYWDKRFTGGRRAEPAGQPAPADSAAVAAAPALN